MVKLRLGALVLAACSASGCEELPRTYSTVGQADTAGPASGGVLFEDHFESPKLGPAWKITGRGARVRDGSLHLRGLRNHPVWLDIALPDDVQISFDAWSDSQDGDIKVELAGDGTSFATEASYTASGYVVIFGGWHNSLDVIARQDEHGADRLERPSAKVEVGRRYHFDIIRRGKEIAWMLDGQLHMRYEDPQPLRGAGQDHFGFNNWTASTHFDNLVITALAPE